MTMPNTAEIATDAETPDAEGVPGNGHPHEPAEPVDADGVGSTDTTPDEDTPPDEDPAEEKRGNAEAAKYRKQLRAAETTIADHEAHIAELQHHVIGGLIADKVADPRVFDKLVDRSAWAGDDGRIDLNKLDAAVAQILEEYPSLKPAGKPSPRMKPQPGRGEPVGDRTAPRPLSSLDRAFPQSDVRMQNLLESHPETGTAGDTIQERNKTRRITAKIGGEDS